MGVEKKQAGGKRDRPLSEKPPYFRQTDTDKTYFWKAIYPMLGRYLKKRIRKTDILPIQTNKSDCKQIG